MGRNDTANDKDEALRGLGRGRKSLNAEYALYGMALNFSDR